MLKTAFFKLTFAQFHYKSGLIGKIKINFSLHGGSFYLHPYFETYQVKTLNLNQSFPYIRQTFKYLLFNFVVFSTIGPV